MEASEQEERLSDYVLALFPPLSSVCWSIHSTSIGSLSSNLQILQIRILGEELGAKESQSISVHEPASIVEQGIGWEMSRKAASGANKKRQHSLCAPPSSTPVVQCSQGW